MTGRLSASEIDNLVEAYLSGESAATCAARFGVHEQTVRNHLARRGVERRVNRRKLTEDEVETAVQRHRAGESSAAIARSLHVSPDTVLREVHAADDSTTPLDHGR